ncbi:MAG: hypothetical protein KDE31_21155, partial [Caldilineaceae bacterium]|nr:hypothetical protein [Caldilineaceae bacterium]
MATASALPDPSSPRLSCTLFGVPAISWAEQPVLITRRQPRALLYRLAMELRPIARSQLCYLFWPDVPESTARRNLTRLLVLLRNALPVATLLLTEGEFIMLDRQRIWSDTVAMTQLLANTEPSTRTAALTQAVDLYRGPFLDGFTLPDCPEFEAWLEGERRAGERRWFESLAALIEAHTAARAYAAAIAIAHRYLESDELAEDVHRRLIALYAAQGERAAALRQFERCAVLLERELGVSPLPETRAVFEAARNGTVLLPARSADDTPSPVSAAPPTPVERGQPNPALPVPTSPLIGRTTEVAEVIALLHQSEVRLLTLSGPGGAGKTRLALAVIDAITADFADGAIFVPLAPLRDATHVLLAIMNALRLPDQGDQPPLGRLQTALRTRELLLVLDNFEHVADAAVEVAALLAAAPKLTVLATSRAPLQIAGEQSYEVLPLALADPAQLSDLAALARVEAIALFLARIRARLPSFRLTAANAPEVAAICTRLDGLPLAIELAAARGALLSPRMLLARLDRRLALLTEGPRDLPERQRTLRATIEWSYRLLDLSEQRLFARLAVFAGSWELTAAEAVVEAIGPLAVSTLDGLQALLDKHLIQRVGTSEGELRFAMLETIREYALERLAEQGEEQVAQQAHAHYYLALAEAAAPALRGAEQIRWLDRLDEEQANVNVALTWLLTTGHPIGALRLAGALQWFWYMRSYLTAGRNWLEQALNQATGSQPGSEPLPHTVTARAHCAAGHLAAFQGDLVAARAHLEASAALCRNNTDRTAQLVLHDALTYLVVTCVWQGDFAVVDTLVDEYNALVHRLNEPWIQAFWSFNMGRAQLHQQQNAVGALPYLREAQMRFRALGDTWFLAQVLLDLGTIVL